MSGRDIRVQIETLRSVNSTAFNGTYQALGSPLSNPARIIKIVNNSNVLVTISDDGVNDKEILPANSFVLLDFSSDRETGNQFSMAANTQIWVKGAAGGGNAGLVYLSVYYAG